MANETVFVSFGNTIDLQLLSDGSAIDLSAVTSMLALIGPVSLHSVNSASDSILWSQSGYSTGEIRCNFGTVSQLNVKLPAKSVRDLDSYFVIYDPSNPNGVVFGPITITFKALPE